MRTCCPRLIAVLTIVSSAVFAQGRRPGANADPEQATRQVASQAAPQGTVAPRMPLLDERSSVTRHRARIGGQDIAYTATAATYILKDDDGIPKASVFFVAYTKDDGDKTKRPVSFVYNGGPGSGSMFTHVGLGPKRVKLSDDGYAMSAPYSMIENGDSFLDATDLVFIDAIGTGYSRPAQGENRAQFFGVVQDATWFSDFIYQYLTRNERWASPKFLMGESYGTTRSAHLAQILQRRHGIFLNGVVLISSVGFAPWGADDRSIFFLPTYVMSAWYHKLLAPDLQKLTAEQLAQRARQFAHGEYAQALEKGDELTPAEYKKIVAEIARYTALSPQYIQETNLRISPQRWFKELLRSQRKTVGRLDSRYTGMDADAAGERPEYDPSQPAYYGAYAAAYQDYLRRELKWNTDMRYYISGNVQPWDRTGNDESAEALRSAMTQQGSMKLLVVSGYYDLATPFNGIEHTISHMMLEPSIRKNVSFTYYEAGHMMYIEKKSREKLHKDVVDFVNSAYKVDASDRTDQ